MNIGCRGDVKIEYLHGDKVYKTIKVKNTGRLPLFNYIARCLAGYYDINSCPKYLRMYHVVDATNIDPSTMFNDETTSSAIPVVNVSLSSSSTESRVQFEFLVPFSTLSSQKSSNVLAIYNTQNRARKDEPSAYLILSSEDEIEESGDSNIKVVWTMIISNKD